MRITLPLVFVCLAAVVNAQGFPTPKPSENHKVLSADEGTWDCKVKMFLQGPSGPPTEFEGTEVNRVICGGLYVETDFTCKMGDQLFEGHGLMGYNPREKAYTGTWVDNFTAAPSQLSGKYDKDSKTLTITSEVYDESTDQMLTQKQVTKWIDESTKDFKIFLVVKAGEKTMDVKIMEMEAKKLK